MNELNWLEQELEKKEGYQSWSPRQYNITISNVEGRFNNFIAQPEANAFTGHSAYPSVL